MACESYALFARRTPLTVVQYPTSSFNEILSSFIFIQYLHTYRHKKTHMHAQLHTQHGMSKNYETFYPLGNNKLVYIRIFQNATLVQLRRYSEVSYGILCPTIEGIALPTRLFETLCNDAEFFDEDHSGALQIGGDVCVTASPNPSVFRDSFSVHRPGTAELSHKVNGRISLISSPSILNLLIKRTPKVHSTSAAD